MSWEHKLHKRSTPLSTVIFLPTHSAEQRGITRACLCLVWEEHTFHFAWCILAYTPHLDITINSSPFYCVRNWGKGTMLACLLLDIVNISRMYYTHDHSKCVLFFCPRLWLWSLPGLSLEMRQATVRQYGLWTFALMMQRSGGWNCWHQWTFVIQVGLWDRLHQWTFASSLPNAYL